MVDGTLDYNAPATFRATRRMSGRLSVLWRFLRIRHARRATMRAVLAEVTDPRLIEDVGLTPPARNELDVFVRSLLPQRL